MKKYILLTLILLLIGLIVFSFSDTHLKRNRNNKLPKGYLTELETNQYKDENGLIWELQPHNMNIFHQPNEDETVIKPEKPYPILENPPSFDIENPNLKLLCELESGASYEAILLPDGTYLTTGTKQGTYNYSHPKGLWGKLMHFFFDMAPGFVTSNYEKV